MSSAATEPPHPQQIDKSSYLIRGIREIRMRVFGGKPAAEKQPGEDDENEKEEAAKRAQRLKEALREKYRLFLVKKESEQEQEGKQVEQPKVNEEQRNLNHITPPHSNEPSPFDGERISSDSAVPRENDRASSAQPPESPDSQAVDSGDNGTTQEHQDESEPEKSRIENGGDVSSTDGAVVAAIVEDNRQDSIEKDHESDVTIEESENQGEIAETENVDEFPADSTEKSQNGDETGYIVVLDEDSTSLSSISDSDIFNADAELVPATLLHQHDDDEEMTAPLIVSLGKPAEKETSSEPVGIDALSDVSEQTEGDVCSILTSTKSGSSLSDLEQGAVVTAMSTESIPAGDIDENGDTTSRKRRAEDDFNEDANVSKRVCSENESSTRPSLNRDVHPSNQMEMTKQKSSEEIKEPVDKESSVQHERDEKSVSGPVIATEPITAAVSTDCGDPVATPAQTDNSTTALLQVGEPEAAALPTEQPIVSPIQTANGIQRRIAGEKPPQRQPRPFDCPYYIRGCKEVGRRWGWSENKYVQLLDPNCTNIAAVYADIYAEEFERLDLEQRNSELDDFPPETHEDTSVAEPENQSTETINTSAIITADAPNEPVTEKDKDQATSEAASKATPASTEKENATIVEEPVNYPVLSIPEPVDAISTPTTVVVTSASTESSPVTISSNLSSRRSELGRLISVVSNKTTSVAASKGTTRPHILSMPSLDADDKQSNDTPALDVTTSAQSLFSTQTSIENQSKEKDSMVPARHSESSTSVTESSTPITTGNSTDDKGNDSDPSDDVEMPLLRIRTDIFMDDDMESTTSEQSTAPRNELAEELERSSRSLTEEEYGSDLNVHTAPRNLVAMAATLPPPLPPSLESTGVWRPPPQTSAGTVVSSQVTAPPVTTAASNLIGVPNLTVGSPAISNPALTPAANRPTSSLPLNNASTAIVPPVSIATPNIHVSTGTRDLSIPPPVITSAHGLNPPSSIGISHISGLTLPVFAPAATATAAAPRPSTSQSEFSTANNANGIPTAVEKEATAEEDIDTLNAYAIEQAEKNLASIKKLVAESKAPGADLAKKSGTITAIMNIQFKLYETFDGMMHSLKMKHKNIPNDPDAPRAPLERKEPNIEDLAAYFEVMLESTLLSRRPNINEKMRGVLVVHITRTVRILGYFMCETKTAEESEKLFQNVNMLLMVKPGLLQKYTQSNLSYHLVSFWQCIRGGTRGLSYGQGALMDHCKYGPKKFLERVEKFKEAYEKRAAQSAPPPPTGSIGSSQQSQVLPEHVRQHLRRGLAAEAQQQQQQHHETCRQINHQVQAGSSQQIRNQATYQSSPSLNPNQVQNVQRTQYNVNAAQIRTAQSGQGSPTMAQHQSYVSVQQQQQRLQQQQQQQRLQQQQIQTQQQPRLLQTPQQMQVQRMPQGLMTHQEYQLHQQQQRQQVQAPTVPIPQQRLQQQQVPNIQIQQQRFQQQQQQQVTNVQTQEQYTTAQRRANAIQQHVSRQRPQQQPAPVYQQVQGYPTNQQIQPQQQQQNNLFLPQHQQTAPQQRNMLVTTTSPAQQNQLLQQRQVFQQQQQQQQSVNYQPPQPALRQALRQQQMPMSHPPVRQQVHQHIVSRQTAPQHQRSSTLLGVAGVQQQRSSPISGLIQQPLAPSSSGSVNAPQISSQSAGTAGSQQQELFYVGDPQHFTCEYAVEHGLIPSQGNLPAGFVGGPMSTEEVTQALGASLQPVEGSLYYESLPSEVIAAQSENINHSSQIPGLGQDDDECMVVGEIPSSNTVTQPGLSYEGIKTSEVPYSVTTPENSTSTINDLNPSAAQSQQPSQYVYRNNSSLEQLLRDTPAANRSIVNAQTANTRISAQNSPQSVQSQSPATVNNSPAITPPQQQVGYTPQATNTAIVTPQSNSQIQAQTVSLFSFPIAGGLASVNIPQNISAPVPARVAPSGKRHRSRNSTEGNRSSPQAFRNESSSRNGNETPVPIITSVTSVTTQNQGRAPTILRPAILRGPSPATTATTATRRGPPDIMDFAISHAQDQANTVYYPDAEGNARSNLLQQQLQQQNRRQNNSNNSNNGGNRAAAPTSTYSRWN